MKDLSDAAFVDEMRPVCAKLLAQADALVARATKEGNARLDSMLPN